MTLDTMAHMQLTYPIWIMDYTLLQTYPQEESRLSNIIRPFSAMV